MEMKVLGFDPFFSGETALDGKVKLVRDFDEFLRQPPHMSTLIPGLLLPLAYAAVFGLAAWARITTADVTA